MWTQWMDWLGRLAALPGCNAGTDEMRFDVVDVLPGWTAYMTWMDWIHCLGGLYALLGWIAGSAWMDQMRGRYGLEAFPAVATITIS